MKRIEDHCVGCSDLGKPCLGDRCRYSHVVVYYCDQCGSELEEIYEVDGEELCEYCLKDKFRKED